MDTIYFEDGEKVRKKEGFIKKKLNQDWFTLLKNHPKNI